MNGVCLIVMHQLTLCMISGFFMNLFPKTAKFFLGLFFCVLFTFSVSQVQAQKSIKVLEKHDNGKLKMQGQLRNEGKVGFWYFYDPNGWLQRKEKWSKGDFVWAIEFNEKHQRTKGMNKRGKETIYKGCNCKN
jgi:hypothetical protein